MGRITPVLLAGGSGTRLWPLSRKSYPKQFSSLLGNESLYQMSALRLVTSKTISFNRPLTITHADFRFIVAEQLQTSGINPGPILLEPEAKNTASAILAASLYLFEQNKDEILFVAPSDHIISDTLALHNVIKSALPHVKNGSIVTFGVDPIRPETGYGYLQLGENVGGKAQQVLNFVEKPKKDLAVSMFNNKNFLWNAGMFMFRVEDIISAFDRHNAVMLEAVSKAVKKGKSDLGFFRLDQDEWKTIENISIDYAIMEKADNLVAIPFTSEWSDLGGWQAIWQQSDKDDDGVALSENALAVDCKNTLLRSESKGQKIVGLGLEDIVAIAMPDAVLVSKKDKVENVKQIVAKLKSSQAIQAEEFPKDHRPWGWFESLALGDTFQVKRIYVNPGGALSLQSHKHRSEHWVVVEGTARVTADDKISLLNKGQSAFIPVGSVHRLENISKLAMILIEVQIGNYLGEDDIVRYEDLYVRQ
ncbi:mannose-1-phosphate guanylyltransferase/mannose-6-phosphate isomerase [bacterium]|nr:mannose-1-phosphate guanylyltransferase/mannose-6-phosphate isomerase [bacterium]